ncbi:MAG: hypothetical protein Q9221_004543 [Calogaya cf. arnoldii]
MYPFGLNGTLAWTTPAGELLQVASCIDNRLVGVDYKRSIERGPDYLDRGKVLEQALDSPQGLGFGIGLSLGMSLEPIERSWLHNRWPRFVFRYKGLEIVLQYTIHDHYIVQEYHIRNNGQEEVSLPYLISSDVCFREHKGESAPIQVLVQNDIENCQFKMAFFLNSNRQCLWAKSGLNEDLEKKSIQLDVADEKLRCRILGGQLVDDNADNELRRRYRKCYDGANTARQSATHDSANFACHKENLIVPAGSTQEIRIVIQLSGLEHAKLGPLDPQSEPLEPTQEIDDGDGQRNTEAEERIRSRQKMLTVKTEQIPARSPGLEGKQQLTQIINGHIDLGLACTAIDWVAEARYHLLMACLIAEYLYREGSYALSNARYIYAKFLSHHGWHSKALEILERLSHILSKARSTTKEFTALRDKVQIRLANMYLGETGSFAEAEEIYRSALSNPTTEEVVLKPYSAHCLERMAWAQIKQDKYEEAHASYSRLLRLPKIRHQTILVNLGFIERKLGRIENAKRRYLEALEATESRSAIDRLHARSGLYVCLLRLGALPEDHPEVGPFLVHRLDLLPLSLCSRSHPTTFGVSCEGFPLQFTLSRHLESLLSTCSIPISLDNDTSGIAFVDADPLGCLHEGRFAYFQFKFLTQIQKHIAETHHQEEHQLALMERIKTTCRGHLVWVFKIAKFNDTWARFYPARGVEFDNTPSENGIPPSRAIEGAYHFSKLWLYLNTWHADWDFVLDLLHSKLEGWLVYLACSRHMDNLWVEQHGYEALRPYDTISADYAGPYHLFPEYQLSDFTMLWLALQQIDHLITSLGNNSDMHSREADDPVKYKYKGVRQAFEESQKSLGSQKIRSCVLKTFVISTQGGRTQATADGKAINYPEANEFNTAPNTVPTDVSPTGDDLDSLGSFQASKVARKILAYRRTVSEYGFVVQSTDISTIEAAIAGFFDDSDEHVVSAWQENLKLQRGLSITSFEDPGRVALTLFAAKFGYSLGNAQVANIEKECLSRLTIALYDSGVFAQTIVDDAPESMRSWVSSSRDYLTQYHLNLELSLVDYVSETATVPSWSLDALSSHGDRHTLFRILLPQDHYMR